MRTCLVALQCFKIWRRRRVWILILSRLGCIRQALKTVSDKMFKRHRRHLLDSGKTKHMEEGFRCRRLGRRLREHLRSSRTMSYRSAGKEKRKSWSETHRHHKRNECPWLPTFWQSNTSLIATRLQKGISGTKIRSTVPLDSGIIWDRSTSFCTVQTSSRSSATGSFSRT